MYNIFIIQQWFFFEWSLQAIWGGLRPPKLPRIFTTVSIPNLRLAHSIFVGGYLAASSSCLYFNMSLDVDHTLGFRCFLRIFQWTASTARSLGQDDVMTLRCALAHARITTHASAANTCDRVSYGLKNKFKLYPVARAYSCMQVHEYYSIWYPNRPTNPSVRRIIVDFFFFYEQSVHTKRKNEKKTKRIGTLAICRSTAVSRLPGYVQGPPKQYFIIIQAHKPIPNHPQTHFIFRPCYCDVVVDRWHGFVGK